MIKIKAQAPKKEVELLYSCNRCCLSNQAHNVILDSMKTQNMRVDLYVKVDINTSLSG